MVPPFLHPKIDFLRVHTKGYHGHGVNGSEYSTSVCQKKKASNHWKGIAHTQSIDIRSVWSLLGRFTLIKFFPGLIERIMKYDAIDLLFSATFNQVIDFWHIWFPILASLWVWWSGEVWGHDLPFPPFLTEIIVLYQIYLFFGVLILLSGIKVDSM